MPSETKHVTVNFKCETIFEKVLTFLVLVLTLTVFVLSVILASNASLFSRDKNIDEFETDYKKVKKYETVFATAGPPNASIIENICDGTKVSLDNIACVVDGVTTPGSSYYLATGEQSGVNITKGYQGDLEVDTVPINTTYWEAGLCPVNVHWHLGTEHFSLGQFDHNGVGPSDDDDHRRLGSYRQGYQCHHYDDSDPKFTTEYDWQHCVNMYVGETYEIHWPHSNMGACGTPNQYQEPFYDGVFCRFATDFEGSLTNAKIGVQGQVFTIVNDEDYYFGDLMHGMLIDGDMGADIAIYTGSTTGTSRNNDDSCSQYTGITWQVDRKCNLISASSFDKMCADMASQRDDMSDDYYPHGSRELVSDAYAADNHETTNN
mmetsp:Transcript_51488/g.70145  ORF Transcript_51488/g.70145 Transcript_51488/m.70145 type:complete len:376 (-) Transcript_51488:135-1262(-)